MLQSFVLIHDSAPNKPPLLPETLLSDMGFRVYAASTEEQLFVSMRKVDAALLCMEPAKVECWRKRVTSIKSMPVLWWCDPITFPSHECQLDPGIDGMIGPGMNSLEIHCSLLLSVNHYFQRTAWQQEREQLLSRLEERKWIDQAKRILSEMKHISEAEAYDLLRKQAMNDRKRIADVATSIVSVYQLLQENKENKGGRRR
jgi:response regulator NasT